VDFVVSDPGGIHAVEVKRSRDVRPADPRALRPIREDHPEPRARLLCMGEEGPAPSALTSELVEAHRSSSSSSHHLLRAEETPGSRAPSTASSRKSASRSR